MQFVKPCLIFMTVGKTSTTSKLVEEVCQIPNSVVAGSIYEMNLVDTLVPSVAQSMY